MSDWMRTKGFWKARPHTWPLKWVLGSPMGNSDEGKDSPKEEEKKTRIRSCHFKNQIDDEGFSSIPKINVPKVEAEGYGE